MNTDLECTEVVLRTGNTLSELRIDTYPNGEPLIVMGEDAVAPDAILLRPKTLQTFLATMFFVDALKARMLPIPDLFLPCVPGMRQDRLNRSGDVLFTLKSIAQMLNAREFPNVFILDPHSDVAPALIERSTTVMPGDYVASHGLKGRYDGVIAPDAGAVKRAAGVAHALQIPMYQGWKRRDITTGALTGFGVQSMPVGEYLVVDDLCDGGGTFIGLADAIGPHQNLLDLYVTHGLFTKGFDELRKSYRHIYTTDSIPLKEKHNDVSVFPVFTTFFEVD